MLVVVIKQFTPEQAAAPSESAVRRAVLPAIEHAVVKEAVTIDEGTEELTEELTEDLTEDENERAKVETHEATAEIPEVGITRFGDGYLLHGMPGSSV